jgi:hypothetical protein
MLILTQENTLFDTKTQKFQDVNIEQNMLHLVSSEGNGTPILQYTVDMILHTNQKYIALEETAHLLSIKIIRTLVYYYAKDFMLIMRISYIIMTDM